MSHPSFPERPWRQFQETAHACLGLELTAARFKQCQILYETLETANQTTNLTRIRGVEDFVTLHLLDSLSLAPLLLKHHGERFSLVDIGSGAGFPALPLAVIFPQARIVAVESVQKKARFIAEAVEAMGLTNVTVVGGRSETLAHQAEYREQFDAATARAVSSLSVLIELCLPFVKVGGQFYAMKTASQSRQELIDAKTATAQLGGSAGYESPITLPGLEGRVLVITGKTAPTSRLHPRKPGIPEKKPL